MSSLALKEEPESFGFSRERLERVSRHFDHYVDDQKVAGWLATISRGDQLVWCGSGGHRDRERSLEVTDDTLWRIYSMTKPVTAVAVMMLHEEGHFELDDDVGQWIEALRAPRVWTGGTASSPETTATRGPVTVRHLLTHTSGLTYGFNFQHPVDAIYRDRGYDFGGGGRGVDLVGAVNDWCSAPLLFEPGTHWNYSVSFDVLGWLVERWSGRPLDVFVNERILRPLAMTDTHWWCAPEKLDRLAMLYVASDSQSRAAERLAKKATREPRWLGGGGGLLSSASDYLRFMTMLLRGGSVGDTRLLSRATVSSMTESHLPEGADINSLLMEGLSNPSRTGLGYGLGFSVVIDPRRSEGVATVGTYAWGGAASTIFWVDPAEDLTVAFYTQLLPSGTYPIRREMESLVYAAMVD